ncbi:NfeD family protein [Chiayiivirga flava]|uniref:NfeD-like C-terminal domain-containing protein n=1 Tax=Chiayiivirga flava TaxID=659595 RepID=A0A7W8G2K7_9GAMM|nr:NfeD family protein [Chiayiivirga flava]MBB5208820.1 hypothetical protein [Chiayiivirga flava]
MHWLDSQWFWWATALALFALEAIAPGTFFLWLGFAALGTGLVHVLVPSLGVAGLWIVFAILSLASVWAGWEVRKRRAPRSSDQPLLNRRAAQLIGRVFPLDTPIENGRGRLKIDDAFWIAEGPELPSGTRVRVDAVDAMTLRVSAVD